MARFLNPAKLLPAIALGMALCASPGYATSPVTKPPVVKPAVVKPKVEGATATTTTTTTTSKKRATTTPRKGKKARQQAETEPVVPPRPLTPEQLPPTRPTVNYRNGQLSIVANNSTMADVLNSVRAQTGAQFEMSGISSADRVYAKLGPGLPKDVLAALFDGSRFNYAILASATDPAAIARVVLMPKAGGAAAPVGAGNPTAVTRPTPAQAQADESDEEQPEEAPAEEVQQEQPQPEQQQQQQPGQTKTPEQLLQELQQMQQQQQQQQQNPNGQPPPPQQQQQIPDREIPD